MNSSRIREENSILQNIKKRELIEMKKKEVKVPAQELKEVIDKRPQRSPAFLNAEPALGGSSLGAPMGALPNMAVAVASSPSGKKDIVSGLLRTRAVLMAPSAATLINPTSASTSPLAGTPSRMSEKEKLEMWVPPPPPMEKPKERPLVRKVGAIIKFIITS